MEDALTRDWHFPALVTRMARSRHRISVVTGSPGFDDRKVSRPGVLVDRTKTQLYRNSWEAAIAVRPQGDWVLVRSFNHWHEGTAIEPSLEFGDQYLKFTAAYAARFKRAASPLQMGQ